MRIMARTRGTIADRVMAGAQAVELLGDGHGAELAVLLALTRRRT
jgi:hypothetical protein